MSLTGGICSILFWYILLPLTLPSRELGCWHRICASQDGPNNFVRVTSDGYRYKRFLYFMCILVTSSTYRGPISILLSIWMMWDLSYYYFIYDFGWCYHFRETTSWVSWTELHSMFQHIIVAYLYQCFRPRWSYIECITTPWINTFSASRVEYGIERANSMDGRSGFGLVGTLLYISCRARHWRMFCADSKCNLWRRNMMYKTSQFVWGLSHHLQRIKKKWVHRVCLSDFIL